MSGPGPTYYNPTNTGGFGVSYIPDSGFVTVSVPRGIGLGDYWIIVFGHSPSNPGGTCGWEGWFSAVSHIDPPPVDGPPPCPPVR